MRALLFLGFLICTFSRAEAALSEIDDIQEASQSVSCPDTAQSQLLSLHPKLEAISIQIVQLKRIKKKVDKAAQIDKGFSNTLSTCEFILFRMDHACISPSSFTADTHDHIQSLMHELRQKLASLPPLQIVDIGLGPDQRLEVGYDLTCASLGLETVPILNRQNINLLSVSMPVIQTELQQAWQAAQSATTVVSNLRQERYSTNLVGSKKISAYKKRDEIEREILGLLEKRIFLLEERLSSSPMLNVLLLPCMHCEQWEKWMADRYDFYNGIKKLKGVREYDDRERRLDGLGIIR